VVHEVSKTLVVLASVHQHTQRVLDSVWDVEPMKLVVHVVSETVIEFPCCSDNARGRVQHSLQPVCYNLQRPSEDWITVIRVI